ncbi:hypothetical protein ACLOJK_021566 [Asimina triloba]
MEWNSENRILEILLEENGNNQGRGLDAVLMVFDKAVNEREVREILSEMASVKIVSAPPPVHISRWEDGRKCLKLRTQPGPWFVQCPLPWP